MILQNDVLRTDATTAREASRIVRVGIAPACLGVPAPLRGRVLTKRARRKLKKQHQRTQAIRNGGQHAWVEKFVAAGVRAYSTVWERRDEPPSPGITKMLRRCGDRFERSGRLDLRQLDRRFWEMLFVCGWWPFAADPAYWPERWQRCRRDVERSRDRQSQGIRQRNRDDAAAAGVAAAYVATPARGSLYEWWCGLHPQTRDMLKDDSRTIYEGKDAFSNRKRKNAKSRTA